MKLIASLLLDDIKSYTEHRIAREQERHIISTPSLRFLIWMKQQSRKSKGKEFYCSLENFSELREEFIDQLKMAAATLPDGQSRQQIIVKLEGSSTHYAVIDIKITPESAECFLLDAANCEDFFRGSVAKLRRLFDEVYVATDKESVISKLQKDYRSCPVFSMDHAAKLANFAELYEFLRRHADAEGILSWDRLPPEFIWNIQSLTEADSYVKLHAERNPHAEYHTKAEHHIASRIRKNPLNLESGKDINASIYLKAESYLKKAAAAIESLSEETLADIMYPEEHFADLRLLAKGLEKRGYAIEPEKVGLWRMLIANKSLLRKMKNNLANLDHERIRHYISSGQLDMLDVLNNKYARDLFSHPQILELILSNIVTPADVIAIEVFPKRLERLHVPRVMETLSTGQVKLSMLLKAREINPEKPDCGLGESSRLPAYGDLLRGNGVFSAAAAPVPLTEAEEADRKPLVQAESLELPHARI